jgi:DNA-binding transcriptional LysR family regulator
MRLYASKSYLEKNGEITSISDIAKHRLICQNPASAQVAAGASLVQQLMSEEHPNLFTINNYFGVLQGVLNNLGIGVLPNYLIQDFPDMVQVLPDTESADVPVFLAYPEELRQSKRVSAFKDFVQDEIITYRKLLRENEKK